VVRQLAVHTIGGVISPGEVIMLVVAVADDLTVEARIAPQDIGQLSLGQDVTLKLSAFNQRVTPELNGSVNEISADLRRAQRRWLLHGARQPAAHGS
jgi:HlyD family secretion protein